MRLFVTGGSGLLGVDLLPLARERGHDVVAPSSTEFDVTDPVGSARLGMGELGKFDWCVNLAAYTNVDGAETHVREATELNILAPAYLAASCLGLGARFLHLSTDYVFGGADGAPYDEGAAPAPVQKYGETKATGEFGVVQANPDALIARVAWLYGPGKRCFPLGLIESFRDGKPLRIADDQWGVPSYTAEVSRMLLDLLESRAESGIYHVAGGDAVNRWQYAQAVGRAYERVTGIPPSDMTAVASTTFPTPARRPANSVLTTDKVRRYTRPHLPLDEAMGLFVQRVLG